MIKMNEGSEESVLKVYANVLLYVGIICSVIITIVGIILAAMLAEDSALTAVVALVASLIIAALLFVPFLLEWAFVHVFTKMSDNISSTNNMVRSILQNMDEGKKKPVASTPVQNKSTKTESKQEPIPLKKEESEHSSQKKEEPCDKMSESDIMNELSKRGSPIDKLCRLMELRDDGMISQKTYDIISETIY